MTTARRRPRLPAVVERKLPVRRLAKGGVLVTYGLYHSDDDLVAVDPRHGPRSRLDTLIHESVHREWRAWVVRLERALDRARTRAAADRVLDRAEEELATRVARTASALLWRDGYRRQANER